MEERKKITEIISVRVPAGNRTSGRITFNDICRTPNVLATDIIVGIENIHGWHEPGFGAMDDEQVYHDYWVIRIEKTREENDEEYIKRLDRIELEKEKTRERDWNEYLRLIAMFKK